MWKKKQTKQEQQKTCKEQRQNALWRVVFQHAVHIRDLIHVWTKQANTTTCQSTHWHWTRMECMWLHCIWKDWFQITLLLRSESQQVAHSLWKGMTEQVERYAKKSRAVDPVLLGNTPRVLWRKQAVHLKDGALNTLEVSTFGNICFLKTLCNILKFVCSRGQFTSRVHPSADKKVQAVMAHVFTGWIQHSTKHVSPVKILV